MGTHPIFESDFDCLTDVGFQAETGRCVGQVHPDRFPRTYACFVGARRQNPFLRSRLRSDRHRLPRTHAAKWPNELGLHLQRIASFRPVRSRLPTGDGMLPPTRTRSRPRSRRKVRPLQHFLAKLHG